MDVFRSAGRQENTYICAHHEMKDAMMNRSKEKKTKTEKRKENTERKRRKETCGR
jgi:hypothetical protein